MDEKVNVARQESYSQNLKAVIEMDRESGRSNSTFSSENEEDAFEDENEEECEAGKRNSLLPTLFEHKSKKKFSLKLEGLHQSGHQSRKTSSISSRSANAQKPTEANAFGQETTKVACEPNESNLPTADETQSTVKKSKKFSIFARSFGRLQKKSESSVPGLENKQPETVTDVTEAERTDKSSILNSIGEDDVSSLFVLKKRNSLGIFAILSIVLYLM